MEKRCENCWIVYDNEIEGFNEFFCERCMGIVDCLRVEVVK